LKLMVVDNFNLLRLIVPAEANSPLVVDPHAVLPLPFALQLLKAVARETKQLFELAGLVNYLQPAPSNRFETLELGHELAGIKCLGQLASEPSHSAYM
jgi:hypothetical protein